MTDLAIDTHRFVKQLMESGFTEAQAETLADAQMQLLASRMATKEDIHDLHSRIDALETSMDAKINALRSDFSVLLMRSQITTGAAIITILSFINYLTG